MREHLELLIERARRLGSRLADSPGITLIESLLACLVVGIAAVGLATMFAKGQVFISGEGDNRVAVYLAQQKIEMARSMCQARITDTNCVNFLTAATTSPDLFSKDMAAVASDPFYTRTTVVDCVAADDYSSIDVDCTTANAAKRVTVTVHARTKEPRQDTDPRPVRLRAVLARR
jgi:Tfp pilus assembly protein PilV